MRAALRKHHDLHLLVIEHELETGDLGVFVPTESVTALTVVRAAAARFERRRHELRCVGENVQLDRRVDRGRAVEHGADEPGPELLEQSHDIGCDPPQPRDSRVVYIGLEQALPRHETLLNLNVAR